MPTITTLPARARRFAVVAAIGAASAALLCTAISPAAGEAAVVPFGAKLTNDVQPSNSSEPRPCALENINSCTRVLNDAYGRAGKHKSPKTGRIKQIKIIAGAPGTFRLQVVKVTGSGDTSRVQVLRQSRVLRYQGQPQLGEDEVAETYRVEKFRVNLRIRRGEQIAASGNLSSMMRCSSGGDNLLEVQPSPRPGSPFKTVTQTDGCWLLMGAYVS